MSAPTPPQPPPGYVSLDVRRDFALAKLLESIAEIIEMCKPLVKSAVDKALADMRKRQ